MRITTSAFRRRYVFPIVAALALGATVAALPRLAAAAIPDYALLDDVLLQNVRNGYVDYDGIAANPKFGAFLAQLAAKPDAIELAEARLAYYINAYNAFAISGILKGYSPGTRLGRSRYFKSLDFQLGGEDVTLEDLEQKRIRPMDEPRAHFAIVCASISCPRLWNRAYIPESLDTQLDDATRRFVNDVVRNRFDVGQRQAFLSRIFDWFGEDFEKSGGSVPAYVARYVDEPATRAALMEGRLKVAYLPYDWDLNGRYEGAGAR